MHPWLKERFLCRRQGKKQRPWFPGNDPEPVALIEGNCPVVFGIDEQGESGGSIMQAPMNCVHQHEFAEATSLKELIHRETADTDCGDRGITRQPLGLVRGKIDKRNTRRR